MDYFQKIEIIVYQSVKIIYQKSYFLLLASIVIYFAAKSINLFILHLGSWGLFIFL